MDVELSIPVAVDAPPANCRVPLLSGETRMRHAIALAKRDGPGAGRFLRRSIGVYASDACRRQVPEERFVDIVRNEVMAILASRVCLRELATLMDAAVEGVMDGYDSQHRVDRLTQLQRHDRTAGGPDAPNRDNPYESNDGARR
jgi:hypothetical protein